jgi:hypothetical protein
LVEGRGGDNSRSDDHFDDEEAVEIWLNNPFLVEVFPELSEEHRTKFISSATHPVSARTTFS